MKKSNRAAAIVAVLLATSLLQACGGGGGDESTVQVFNNSLPDGHAQALASGESRVITLSQPSVNVDFLKDDGRIKITQTQSVHIDFQQDDLFIGYAPGAPQVDWLYLPSSKQTLHEKSFDLRMEIFPTTHATGVLSTTLRIVNRKADGTGSTYVDLPVYMNIHAMPSVYNGGVNATATVGAAPTSPIVVPLDFGDLPSPVVDASLVDGNSVTSLWLDVQVNPDGKSLTLTPKASGSGRYTGYVNIHYKTLGSTAEKRIPVTLLATANTPTVHHVSPTRAVPNQPVDLLITGEGFSLGDIKKVQLGSAVASSFARLSDTQLSAHFDALIGNGDQTVSVTVGSRTVQADNALLIAADVPLPNSVIKVGEDVLQVRYDERTLALFVATRQRFYRMQLVGGQWQTMATRVMLFQDFELSGDGRQLVFLNTTSVTLVDANTLEDVAIRPLPNSSGNPSGYDWVTLHGVMHNGDLVLSLPDGDFSKTYSGKLAVYHMASGILDISPHSGVMLMAAQNSRRDMLKLVSNWSSPPSFFGDYLSTSDTFVTSTLPGTGIGANRFTMSGDGSRVMLGDYIYDVATASKIPVTDSTFYNYYPVLSPDGKRFYAVSEDDRGIGDFEVGSDSLTLRESIPAPLDQPSTMWASITPSGQAVIKLGKTGFDGRYTSVYIIPVR